MNFVHTLWTRPLLYGNKRGNELKEYIEVIAFNYALSMRLVLLHGHTITLYTDKDGASLLSVLPYNKVVVLPMQDLDILFAALIKFEALEICDKEDFIIDGDIMLGKSGIYDKLKAMKEVNDCIYSIVETFEDQLELVNRFKPVIDIISNSVLLPGYKATEENIHYPNTSIMFIKNMDLRLLYLELYRYHKSILQGKDFKEAWPDIWIEQYFLGLLLNNNKQYIHSPVIADYPNEEEALRLGLTHLAGMKVLLHPYMFVNLAKLDNLLCNKLVQHLLGMYKKYIK